MEWVGWALLGVVGILILIGLVIDIRMRIIAVRDRELILGILHEMFERHMAKEVFTTISTLFKRAQADKEISDENKDTHKVVFCTMEDVIEQAKKHMTPEEAKQAEADVKKMEELYEEEKR